MDLERFPVSPDRHTYSTCLTSPGCIRRRRTASSAACGRGFVCRRTTFTYLALGARVHRLKVMAFGSRPEDLPPRGQGTGADVGEGRTLEEGRGARPWRP